MRTLVVSHLWPRRDAPHLGIFVAEQAAALAQRCDVSVVVPIDRLVRREELTPGEIISGLNGYRRRLRTEFLPIPGLEPARTYYRARIFRQTFASVSAQHLARSLRDISLEGVDLVHAHTLYPDGLACAYWLANRDIPLVVTAHGSDVHSLADSVKNALVDLFQRVDAVIAVSRFLKEHLSAVGADTRRIEVIPNGFSAPLFDRANKSRKDNDNIAFLGRLTPLKRVDLLIRALAECPARVVLQIGGEGPERKSLEALVRSLRLQDRVHFWGSVPRERVPDFLMGASLLCLVSTKEGWPTVILEALACGTPVLATSVGGIPEILARPELGHLVAADISASRLAREIQHALQRDWKPSALQKFAREYSWEAISERILAVYSSTLGAAEERDAKKAG